VCVCVCVCACACVADPLCADDTGATAWDYASAKHLHYCMLIIASYLRQRTRGSRSRGDAGATNHTSLGAQQPQVNWHFAGSC